MKRPFKDFMEILNIFFLFTYVFIYCFIERELYVSSVDKLSDVQCDDLIHMYYCGMITPVKSVNTSMSSHNCHFLCGQEHLKSTLLTTLNHVLVWLIIVTMLDIRFPEVVLTARSLFLLANNSPVPSTPAPGSHHCIPYFNGFGIFTFHMRTYRICISLNYFLKGSWVSVYPSTSIGFS